MWGWVQFSSRSQIDPEIFDVTCVSSVSAGKVIALFVKVQSYPAGLHFHTAYINLRQVGFPVSSAKKSSPLRNSAQMELICVTGCHVSFKRKTGSAQSGLLSPGIQSYPAASVPRQLPPSWASVGVVCPLVPLEVVLYNVTVALLFNAF